MRTFNFKARNIGDEKYLTYTMGEECELDEDLLDYCEDNDVKEILDIIYEEDEDYDYLTYDITNLTSLSDYTVNPLRCEQVLNIVRNTAASLVSLKEQTIQLTYILLNKNYIYIDENTFELKFICLPVENKGSVSAEFKGFVRQLLANAQYDVDEELGYVGKLLTYINSAAFNLRGLIGLSEALMEEAGIGFEESTSTTEDGVEVVSSDEAVIGSTQEEKENVSEFMNNLSETDEPLPEIGDDEDGDDKPDEEEEIADDGELDSILPAGMKIPEPEDKEAEEEISKEEAPKAEDVPKAEEAPKKENIIEADVPEIKVIQDDTSETVPQPEVKEPADASENSAVKENKKETDVNLIKNRIKELVGEVPTAKTKADKGETIKTLAELDQLLDSKPPVIKKNVVKVNRAALIQSAAEHESATDELKAEDAAGAPAVQNEAENTAHTNEPADAQEAKEKKPKSNSILSKTIEDPKVNTLLNAPKANPYLIRVNTDERIMIMKATFKIGKATRGVDYTVSGNGAISRQHAIITQRDGVCYIRDNKSTNHTYVNGKMLEEGAEEILTHDSIIRLGDEEFQFKIK